MTEFATVEEVDTGSIEEVETGSIEEVETGSIKVLRPHRDTKGGRRQRASQPVLMTFDFEGRWGMPHAVPYDADRATGEILSILERHRAKAVFFVTGKIVEERPELVRELSAGGHEIGLHGYRHEDFPRLTPPARHEFGQRLKEVCHQVESLAGRPPVAYRAPYLLYPAFSEPDLDRVLTECRFTWTSNRPVQFSEVLFRPDRVPWAQVRTAAEVIGLFDERGLLGAAAALALNVGVLRRELNLGGPKARLRWLLRGRPIYRRGQLIEVALQAPLDCDLLGLPRPDQPTEHDLLGFAARRLAAAPQRAGSPCVLSFHDWIVGTSNRPGLLDEVLSRIAAGGAPLLDASRWRPG